MAVWIVSTVYLALALAICVGVLLLVYWAFTQLPERFGGSGGGQQERRIETKRRGSR